MARDRDAHGRTSLRAGSKPPTRSSSPRQRHHEASAIGRRRTQGTRVAAMRTKLARSGRHEYPLNLTISPFWRRAQLFAPGAYNPWMHLGFRGKSENDIANRDKRTVGFCTRIGVFKPLLTLYTCQRSSGGFHAAKHRSQTGSTRDSRWRNSGLRFAFGADCGDHCRWKSPGRG